MTVASARVDVIVNRLSGEAIVIRASGGETGGDLLAWELFLAPGGAVPSAHAHPTQEERFTVLAGRMRFRVAGRSTVVGPGETVTVAPGVVHHFANAGPRPAHVAVETRPALAMEAMLRTAAAQAEEQAASGRAWPRLVDLALFMDEFAPEVRAPHLSSSVRLVTHQLARLARRAGRDGRYRGLRARGDRLSGV